MALRTLYQALLDSELARMRVIARLWEIPLTAERRPDLAAQLADGMARTSAVEAAWKALSSEEQAALEDLLRHENGAIPWAVFTRRWGGVRAVGPGRLEREALWRTPISPAEGLWYHGFLQRAFQETAAGSVEMAFVPEELKLYLPSPPPLPALAPDPIAPPAAPLPYGDTLADDLTVLWSYLQTETMRKIPLALDHGWPPRHRRTVLRRINPPAETRLALLETLSLEQGWIRLEPNGRLRPAPEPVVTWLRSDRWSQWQTLAQAWITSRDWNDLAVVPTLRPDPSDGWPADPRAARQAFLQLLKSCTPGVWYAVADFIRIIKDQNPEFLRASGDYERAAPQDAVTHAPLRGFGAWESVEGALIAAYLTGPLNWLGAVELGAYAPALAPHAFRLTAAGAALLELAPPPPLAELAPVTLRPDGSLQIPPGRRYELFQLSRIARPAHDTAPGRYRLSPRMLARARHQGIPLERILSFLEEATGQPVAPILQRALERAYQTADEARLEKLWLLQVRVPALLEKPALRALMHQPLGPHAALIREADRERTLAQLLQEGLLPETDDDI